MLLWESWESSLLLSTLCHVRTQRELSSLEPRRRAFLELDLAGTLICKPGLETPSFQNFHSIINKFLLVRAPSLWYSAIVTQSKTIITPVGKREHPRKCSLLNYPASSSPRLRPRPPWKSHDHDLFLVAKHLLWWCVGAASWKKLALELAGNLPSGVPGEASHWDVLRTRICYEPNQRAARGSCLLLSAAGCFELQGQELQKLQGNRNTTETKKRRPFFLLHLSWQSFMLVQLTKKWCHWEAINPSTDPHQLFILSTSMSLISSSLLTRFVTLILLLALFLFLHRI